MADERLLQRPARSKPSFAHSRSVQRAVNHVHREQPHHRNNRRKPIFKDNADRRRFLEMLREACAKTGWQVHAYILMPDHFHLVVETPQLNSCRVVGGRLVGLEAPEMFQVEG